MIKIVSGKYRGQNIMTPGEGTHPMGAREKLALFNMIGDFLPGARVLDAFAGSGALGIEALSRGALEVVFVEKNAKAVQIIRQNLKNLGLNGEVVTANVVNFTTDEKFDVILADPPYDDFNVTEIVGLDEMLNAGGILVLSHPGDELELPGLVLEKSRKYAAARISVYAKE